MESGFLPRPKPDSTEPNGPSLSGGPGSAEYPAPDQTTADNRPLHAVHTPNFPTLLRQLGASLLVTTYQAGKLVIVRDEGNHLNAHFRNFPAPMGMALDGDRLAIGTDRHLDSRMTSPELSQFHNCDGQIF